MKKNFQLIVFTLLFVVFSSNINAVTKENKNFCNTNQSYIFPCENMYKQCTYKDKSKEYSDTYINIDNKFNAKAYYEDETEDISNWYETNEYVSFKAQTWVKKNKACPKYYFLAKDGQNNQYSFAINSLSDVDTSKLKSITFITYQLSSETTNTAKSTSTKDFCDSGQKYYFNCDQMKLQCTYNNQDGEYAYLNISQANQAKAGIGDETGKDIGNWGMTSAMSIDAKEYYEKNNECPPYFLESNGEYFFTDKAHFEKDKKSISSDNYYTYYSNTTNVENSKKDDNIISCAGFKDETTCKVGKNSSGDNFGCAWNEKYSFCSPNGLAYISCGTGTNAAYDIPKIAPQLTSYVIMALKTVTPIVLIIMGMFQLVKAIASQKEDEIKKARGSLIKKVIAAVIIFFTISIFQFVVDKVADNSEQSSMRQCLKCFLNGDCKGSSYYTDGYGNCYNISNNEKMNSCPGKK